MSSTSTRIRTRNRTTANTTDEEGKAVASLDHQDEAPAADLPDQPETGRMRTFRVTGLITVLVVAILAGALAFAALRIRDMNSQNSLRSSALKTAATYGVYLSSYDYRSLNTPTSAWSEVAKHSTPTFRNSFTKTSGNLAELLNRYSATAKGAVVAAGISSVSSSRAVVLLFIDQTVTNSVQTPNSVSQPLRVRLTMLRQHGQWLIDSLEVPK